tara:strand:+ start:2004 stop:2228 length:225 start_codon:yes stop_codon:yes gene_type:complete
MQKWSNNIFANKDELKKWCIALHNSLGGVTATTDLIMKEKDMNEVKLLCEIFILQWNENMIIAEQMAKKKQEEE